MRNKPIGIFDSGIGGLTVQRAIASLLPNEDTIYLGDTAHVPYGTKSRATVTRYSLGIAEFLADEGVKLIVVACNTASAYAIDALRERFDVPIVGVIEPGARAAVKATKSSGIGVIGTEGTIRSGAYFDAIKALNEKVAVYLKACPLFVPLAEEGFTSNVIAHLTAAEYLSPMKDDGVDTLVLGCTHYPLLKGVIAAVMGKGVKLIDSGEATAEAVEAELARKKILRGPRKRGGTHKYFVTDSPERFMRVGNGFLGEVIKKVELVDLGD
jgi:glutamate racemase